MYVWQCAQIFTVAFEHDHVGWVGVVEEGPARFGSWESSEVRIPAVAR